MKKLIAFLLIAISLSTMGCSKNNSDAGSEEKIDFTVVDNQSMPEELRDVIREKQENAFQMSANIEGYTYIVVGYGKQDTGGYSIAVEELVQNDKSVKIRTTLIGPTPNEAVNRMETYPLIVVKIEQTDKIIEYL